MIDSSEHLQDLILGIVKEIVTADSSIQDLIAWTEDEIALTFEGAEELPPEARRYMACYLARMTSNITPQPAHGFRVVKITDPGRNEKCVAGFDCKHKQCCGQIPRLPALGPEIGWLGLCESMTKEQLDALLASGRLPDGMLHLVARRLLESDPKRVRMMLEPRFAGPLGALKEGAAEMMRVLADVYDVLDKPRLKSKLIKRAIAEGRGALRADALQRMATMLADQSDFDGAWEHFRQAQRENPDAPSLSHLEVILLINQERHAEAAERAKFWLAKLKRDGWGDGDDPMMELLREAAAGRAGEAISGVTAMTAGEHVQRFVAAVRRALDTPVEAGRVQAQRIADFDEGDFVPDIVGRLKGMGLSEKEARREAEKLQTEMANKMALPKTAESQSQLPFEAASADRELILTGDARLVELESDWHRVWPCAKPFSTAPVPHQEFDPWQPARAELWVGFVEQHPEAAQSLDLLDDWLIAIRLLGGSAQDWISRELAPRLGARAHDVIQGAGVGEGELPWGAVENRPVLRLLVSRAYDTHYAGDATSARKQMRELLQLNPNDNHGIRMTLVNLDLAAGDDAAALEVIGRFKDDGSPALLYGEALAWFRKGDQLRADAALKVARKHCGKIESWLLPSRKAQPKMSPYGVTVDGDDEAWLYREQMRPVWSATPRALDWLKRV